MEYDTTIRTVTETKRLTTVHISKIDWDYNFDDPKHTDTMGTNEEGKRQRISQCENALKFVDDNWPNENLWVEAGSDYLHRVIGIGMVSQWPYWEPRPCVLLQGAMHDEWRDWRDLRHAELRPAK